MLSRNTPLVNKYEYVMKSVTCWFYCPIDFISLANTLMKSQHFESFSKCQEFDVSGTFHQLSYHWSSREVN
jgi:Pyruvate/2-oxoacid:ferredoxin oxidoreductase delta subunit